MAISEPTAVFSIRDDRDAEIKQAVLQVYRALEEKGYNPINQLVGYILSEDPTYITTYKNARAIIRRIDRDDLLQALVRDFVKGCLFIKICKTARVLCLAHRRLFLLYLLRFRTLRLFSRQKRRSARR